MPTENVELETGNLFIQTKEDEEPKELKAIDINFEEIEQEEKTFTGQGTVTFDVKLTRRIKKMLGMERITRKRFKKLLMGCGMRRNDAETIADVIRKTKLGYSPLMVQTVIEWITKKADI